jgi:signal transduction histidine kinase
MRSLRSRLILGSALVAVVPLAVAMVLLSRRIERTASAEATARLDEALGTLQVEVEADGKRLLEKLQILARDPQLKRLYLVHPAGRRDLPEYLAERRFLLGLDFLQVADTNGMIVADGSPALADTGRTPGTLRLRAARSGSGPSLGMEAPEGAAGLALAASVSIPYQHEVVGEVQGGLWFDEAYLARRKRIAGVELILHDAGGRTLATTLDGADLARIPPSDPGRSAEQRDDAVDAVVIANQSYLGRSFPLTIGPPPHATLTGLVSTEARDRTVASMQSTSLLLGILGLGIAILLGVLWSSQVSRPVERLAAFSDRVSQGHWDEPLRLRSVREIETLVGALDRMRSDLQTYRDRLVTSERQAAWSQMARKVAHEIKNPLTPIAISVADLRRSYELKRPDFPQILDQAVKTIAEEVATLTRLLQEFSDFGRLPAPRFENCRLSDLLADLGMLYGHEVAAGRLVLGPAPRQITLSADGGQIRQALVNLIKNGLEATGDRGSVRVGAEVEGEMTAITIADDGPGLDAERRAQLFVPGFTTKAEGSGLGLTIVERIVNDHHGTISVDSTPGVGTTFRIRIPRVQPGEEH